MSQLYVRCEPDIGVLYDSVLFFYSMVEAVEGRQMSLLHIQAGFTPF